MDTERTPVTYVATCLYGLEAVLAAEVKDRLGAQAERNWCEVAFAFDGDAVLLKELRVAGNLFLEFDRVRIGRTVPELRVLASRLRLLPVDLWEEHWRQLQGAPDGDISVSVRRKGDHTFTYADVEELAADVLLSATGRKVTLDPRPLELRVDIHEDWCRLMGRLTPVPLSERPYRRYRSPGETDPALAAAMVRLARPEQDGVFLDPFCGGGTIPIERALAGPPARIAAGEINPKRLGWATGNAEAARAPVLFGQWDAFALPFRSMCFTRIVASPPQSNPVSGRPWRRDKFGRLLAESLRVLQYGGRMVWLMLRSPLFKGALKRVGGSVKVKQLACSWKGKAWTIYTIEKPL